jgi:hypothetical protein
MTGMSAKNETTDQAPVIEDLGAENVETIKGGIQKLGGKRLTLQGDGTYSGMNS